MSFSIHPIIERLVWESFVLSQPEANFLHSWNWGVFHQALGKKVFYLGIYQDSQLLGVALVIKETAKRGHYLTLGGGPLLDWHQSSSAMELFTYLNSLAQSEHCLFVRVRPQILDTPENKQLFTHLGLHPSPMHLTADLTLQLDLTKSLDQILIEMRKSTRYEIKRIDKLNIKVTSSSDPAQIKDFYQHQLNLAKKHKFVPFSYRFLSEQFQAFLPDNQVLLFHARHNQQLLASAFIIFYGHEAIYHYGISTPQNQHLPGSYAVLWLAIQEAKSRGLTRFNFWGIAPEGKTDHRFSGVTMFKKGFGGQEVAYLPAHDLPTSPLYTATKTFETLRAKFRKLS